jgi:wyosine [tRNA(Phe)-imidazoG37] synthetase (radical SAM superfamily)
MPLGQHIPKHIQEPTHLDRVRKLSADGFTVPQIAKRIGVGETIVKKMRRTLGISKPHTPIHWPPIDERIKAQWENPRRGWQTQLAQEFNTTPAQISCRLLKLRKEESAKPLNVSNETYQYYDYAADYKRMEDEWYHKRLKRLKHLSKEEFHEWLKTREGQRFMAQENKKLNSCMIRCNAEDEIIRIPEME